MQRVVLGRTSRKWSWSRAVAFAAVAWAGFTMLTMDGAAARADESEGPARTNDGGPARASGKATEPTTFGLSISIAHVDGAPVRDDAWIRTQIEDANRLYEPFGVRFRWTQEKSIPAARANVRTPAERDAFASSTEPSLIDVFLVASLEDIDEPGRMRKGVCWTSHPEKKRYIVLSAAAPPTVLAHELGHFFGNPHSDVVDNVMSYSRTGRFPFFDDLQASRIQSYARRFLASRRLLDVGPARRLP